MESILEQAQSIWLFGRSLMISNRGRTQYNPIERVWGVLEHHWNGDILDEIETVVNFAQTMTWMGKHPVVTLVKKAYQTGVKLTQKAMAHVETQIERLTHSTLEGLPDLGKWFVDISYRPG
jgi:Rhodopirellula transposase DDE domain